MEQKSSQVSLTVKSSPSYTTTLPQASSSSPYVTVPGGVSSDIPTTQDIVDQQIMMRCNVAREFPNPQMATYLGDKLADMYRKRKEKAEGQLSIAQTIGSIDNLLWSAMGAIAGTVLSGVSAGLAGVAISWLAKESTSAVDSWIGDLEEAVANSYVTVDQLNQLALIAGEPELMETIKMSVSQLTKEQLYPELVNLIEKYNETKHLIKFIPHTLFDRSPVLQLNVFFAQATMQITMKYICDALMGEDTPLTATITPMTPDSSPPGSGVPSASGETVVGDGTQKKGGLLPILIALGIGAYALL